jgi:histidine triad (HIT) family protein
MSSDCIFCRIVAGEVPAKFVHQDDEVVAFEDVNPQAPTHCLVIPREHVPSALDVAERHAALLARIFAVAQKIARERKLENGFRIVVNNGPEAGQTVYHLHFHVIGGRGMKWPPG